MINNSKEMTKCNLPFKKGDILFNSTSKKFVYVYEFKFDSRTKYKRDNQIIECAFMVIGRPSDEFIVIEPLHKITSYMTRYGNKSDIGMSMKEIKSIDIGKVDFKEQFYTLEKIYREIKLNFLTSY